MNDQPAWRPPATFIWVYTSLMVSMLLSALDQTIVSTALPTVVGELGNISLMAWVITAYTLAVTISMPIYGKLGDLTGRRIPFLTALILLVLGSAFCGFSESVGQLIAFRALQGLGGGGLMVLSQAIIAEIVPVRERPKYLAPLGAVFGIASVLGPLLGGLLTDAAHWRWVFWINLPVGALALLATIFGLKLPRHKETFKVDLLGIAFMSAAVSTLTLVSSWAGFQYSWTSPVILGLTVIFFISAAAFVWVESRATDPVIPLTLFANPVFSIANLLGILAALGMFAAISYMPTYLQMVYGLNATVSGYLILPMVVGIMVMGTASGLVISRTGRSKVFPVAGMALIGFSLWLLSTLSHSNPYWLVAAYLGVLGLGLGCVLQVLVLVVQNAFSSRQLGTATSANNFFREIGATLGIAVVGSVFSSRLATRLAVLESQSLTVANSVEEITPALVRSLPSVDQQAVIQAYSAALTPIFLYLVPVFVAATILAFFLPERKLATHEEAPLH